MIMNFTVILKRISRLKTDLLLNSIIFSQSSCFLEKKVVFTAEPLQYFWKSSTSTQSGVHPEAIEPIEDVSVMLMDNMKLYFLILYLLIILLFILLYKLLKRSKKKKSQRDFENWQNSFAERKKYDFVNDKAGYPIRNTDEEREIMSGEVKEEILKKLLVFEEGCKFTDKNFNLSALSVKLKTNTKYLSYIINKYKKKDFNSYINELRILYIIKKMENNPAYLNYKISYLAEECGFSSHSKFTAVFKSVVGMSPSRFMDMLTERRN